MLTTFERLPPRDQAELPQKLLDSWVTPDGDVAAEFRRIANGFLVRFPGQADFEISLADGHVKGTPVDADAPLETLYRNSIIPVIGNHLGGLHLHGSAVSVEVEKGAGTDAGTGAIAFMGLSRRGKTTLAGAFAKAGHPFLTEDAVSLDLTHGEYLVQPQRPVLRLFADSAAHLLGAEPDWEDDDAKTEVAAGETLPFADSPAPLQAIFILGPGQSEHITITQLSEAEAISQLIQNAFMLDVEDKARLRAHFGRIAALAAHVPCHALDYPRSYAQLPRVIAAISEKIQRVG